MLGNEAIVRGALEGAVQFITTYPGTPTSEIGDAFAKIAPQKNIYFEYSINEKVALETAAGASLSGLKSLVAMKNFGLNVASDFLIPLVYTGISEALVVIVGDDPGCTSSGQSEQDSRAFSYLARIPTMEPTTPQECKDFVKLAFEISEKFQIPVMVKLTTRAALQSGIVKLDRFNWHRHNGKFIKNPHQFVILPPQVLEMKKGLLLKIGKIKQEISARPNLNKVFIQSRTNILKKLGIITSGVSFLYSQEALQELKLNIPILKLDFFYPLSQTKIKKFIQNLDKVLIVEELEPYLEKEISVIAKNTNPNLEILGKKQIPLIGELNTDKVISAIAQLADQKWTPLLSTAIISRRTPQFCPGCPYWFIFQAVKKAVDVKKVIFGGEIGCSMLAGFKPIEILDYLYCMGSSISVACGIKKSTNQKVISFIGDSSFFHSGIPALINSAYNQSNPLIIILDNQTTAMTGHQPHPGIKKLGQSMPIIKIENIVKACGIENLKIIDPIKIDEMISTIKDFLNKPRTSVIIARRACIKIK
ncbi:MAG: indolepyruvate ferredoxin oxidoreductase subunit alpha [Candidatus Portnoybacteria bacterium CG10_big_fil_rev_8_21_14_0_10_40_22]|uniref:Indolepyruvate oxidoreductase subunit IorA n=1 Tax=Candidatus Portnoybacteria bacterium CG10_big_fil_rev_8_21_14_0_10_40_22 TaxID=1974814 RepID=A0A2M8KFI2_9BACT|nr:MAG: indolepyruvate ferredoxin oxidoreductase subunit alpha [Candidatus Portnoybacteria bacterium CG10_big_fil_rev_8_21_14_0_10_40_22]